MDCPVCKYPNPQGATHCGMCYEVFNRSAAQNYLHAVQRERRESEGPPEEPSGANKPQRFLKDAESLIHKIDWSRINETGAAAAKRFWKPALAVVGVIVLWMFISFLFSASLWFHLFGTKLTYAFSEKTSAQYLVGTKQSIKSWSERQGRLDTPMEQFKLEEMGNVLLEKTKSSSKNQIAIFARAKEWIQILNDTAGATSHAIPKNHPSLAEARLIFSKKGLLLERRYTPSPRLAKSLPFLSPRFPKDRLRRGKTWTEEIQWIDVYNDWKIDWAGTLSWTMGELEPYGDNTCAILTYTAILRPRLRGSPPWAKEVVRDVSASVSTEGSALFDTGHHRLVSNTFSYDGLLHIPIKDVGRIPWDLRIGRGVKNRPGEIVIHFENKIDIRKN